MIENNISCLHFGYIAKVIPLAFNESMSYLECVYAIQYSLNETIKQVNNITDFLKDFEVDFTNLQNQIDVLKKQITDINLKINNLESEIINNVNKILKEQNDYITNELKAYETITDNKLSILKTDLENQIKEIELGNVQAYNPTTGTYTSVSQAIEDVYNAGRTQAINCSEFDALELTATEYDNKDINAFDFDNNSKTLLTA